jgi:hypothetical protein
MDDTDQISQESTNDDSPQENDSSGREVESGQNPESQSHSSKGMKSKSSTPSNKSPIPSPKGPNIPGASNKHAVSAAQALAKQDAEAALKEGGKALIEEAKKKAAMAILSNPYVLAAIGIILLIFLLVFAIIMIFEGSDGNTPDSPVSIVKSGPAEVPNGTNIEYRFTVTFNGIADDILVRDAIPTDTEYVISSPSAKALDASGVEASDVTLVKSVEWSMKDIQNAAPQSSFSPQTLSLTVRPLKSDIYIINQATSTLIGGIGNPNITPNPSGIISPNEDDCGGYYTSSINKNPLKKNFGDPSCTMLANNKPEDKAKLHQLLTLLDSQYANYWFTVIIPCESSFNPNNYANYYPELHDEYPSLDPDGVWGLLQMGSDLDGDGSGKNGPLDRGDVDWARQIANGVDYSRWIQTQGGGQWAYWQCANDTHP